MTARARLRRWNDAIQPSESADLLVEGDVNKFLQVDERQKLADLPGNAELTGLLAGKVAATEKGAANGVATLDGGGKVPAVQLPSYVDDVVEFANLAAFPGTGEAGKIYIAVNGAIPANPSKQYRWSGSAYTEISPSPGSTDAVPEGSGNLYYTASRVRDAVLTGLSVASIAVVSATDTVLSAIGKLQAQVSTKAAIQSPHFQSNITVLSGAFGTNGYIALNAGDPTHTGFLDLNAKDGTRAAYIGYAEDVFKVIQFYAQNGYKWGFHGDVSFDDRPTYGGVGLATLAEVAGGGGVAGVSSFKGRTGTVDPSNGDYSSSQISHGGGTVSTALAALEFDTLDGGTV